VSPSSSRVLCGGSNRVWDIVAVVDSGKDCASRRVSGWEKHSHAPSGNEGYETDITKFENSEVNNEVEVTRECQLDRV